MNIQKVTPKVELLAHTPDPENTKKYAALFETYKQIHDALAPIYHKD